MDVLLREITNLLFSEKKLDTILIGTGRLGRAISGYLTAEAKGYQLIAAFDKNPEEIGRQLSGVDILDIGPITDMSEPDGEKSAYTSARNV